MTGSARVWSDRCLGWGAIPGLIAATIVALAIVVLPLKWAVALVGLAIGVVSIAVYPQLSLLVLIPAVPFGSLLQFNVGILNVGWLEAAVGIVAFAWLLSMVASRQRTLIVGPLFLPLCAFVSVLTLSMLNATSLGHSLKELSKWIEFLIVYAFVVNKIDDRWRSLLFVVILGTGALAAVQGIYQFLFQVGPEGFILTGRFMRAYGMFDQPNPYGGYLGLVVPLAIGVIATGIMTRDSSSRRNGVRLLWAGACASLMLAALAMSWSRGAWLGFGAAVAIMILAVAVRSGRAALLGLVFGILLLYAVLTVNVSIIPPSVVQRFADFVPYLGVADVRGLDITDANFSVLERLAHWQAALGMWADHPWLGVGIGNYESVYSAYALPGWQLALGHAHNYYFNIGAEAGVAGLVAFALLWGVAWLGAWRAAQQAKSLYWGWALGILGALTHLVVHNALDNLFVHGMYLHLAVLVGMVPSLSTEQGS